MSASVHREIAIVGAGLVGSLVAVYLRDRGHDVTVIERRPDRRADEAEAGRSINLVLTRRGTRALGAVNLADGALALTVPVHGRMVHERDGTQRFQPYGRDRSESNHSISRAGLNEYLVREAARRGVRFRFDSKLVDYDVAGNRLAFVDERTGRSFGIEAEFVVGADGAGSAVRAALVRAGRVRESVETLDHGYKELAIPAAERGGFRIDGNALHIWPRGEFMLMALPNLDGSFTVTLYLPYCGEPGFDSVASPGEVHALFRKHFPDAAPLIADLAGEFGRNPTGSLSTVRCEPWNVDGRAVLIGDAAHAIVPFFGQGMNAGFEDCRVLGQLLDERGGDLGAAFTDLGRHRKPDSDAIADMALDNFVEMRDLVGHAAFLLQKEVEHRLEQEMPDEYRSRYSMVMYSHIPFRTAMEAGKIQQSILEELCSGLDAADRIDLDRARRLIRERLTPFLAQRGVSLDY